MANWIGSRAWFSCVRIVPLHAVLPAPWLIYTLYRPLYNNSSHIRLLCSIWSRKPSRDLPNDILSQGYFSDWIYHLCVNHHLITFILYDQHPFQYILLTIFIVVLDDVIGRHVWTRAAGTGRRQLWTPWSHGTVMSSFVISWTSYDGLVSHPSRVLSSPLSTR